MFSVHTAVDKFKNATITGHFGFVFEENSARELTWLSPCPRFRKAPFSKKKFFSALKRKAGVFKFSFIEEPSRKAPLSWRISVNGSPKHRNKAAFSIPSAWCKPAWATTMVTLRNEHSHLTDELFNPQAHSVSISLTDLSHAQRKPSRNKINK